jgi:hypothetical protein
MIISKEYKFTVVSFTANHERLTCKNTALDNRADEEKALTQHFVHDNDLF